MLSLSLILQKNMNHRCEMMSFPIPHIPCRDHVIPGFPLLCYSAGFEYIIKHPTETIKHSVNPGDNAVQF